MSKRQVAIIALVLFAAGLIGMYFIGQRLGAAYRTRLTLCIDDPGTGGGRGLAQLLQYLGYPVQGFAEPLWEVATAAAAESGICVITAGDGRWQPPNLHEADTAWARLREWVARGNVLVAITTDTAQLPPLVDERPVLALEPAQAFEFFQAVEPIDREEAGRQISIISTPYGALAVRTNGPRLGHELPECEQYSDNLGAVFIEKRIGSGRVIVLLDNFAWTNAGLDYRKNAATLAQLLASSGVKQVYIDEYRHGHGRADSFVTFAMALPGADSFIAMMALMGLIYLWAANRRFGPPEPYELPERRTATEYIDAVADLYRRAHAAPLAVAAVAERVRFIGQYRGGVDELSELLGEAQSYVERGERSAKPTEACLIVHKLIQARKQRYGY